MSSGWQATCVAIGGRGVLIEGAAGTGKSSLALALIDRGAVLVGDDSVRLAPHRGGVSASPHPATRGLLEVRGVGLVELPVAEGIPVCLVITLDPAAPRFVEIADTTERADVALPHLLLFPDSPVLALRAELALSRHGLPLPDGH